MRQISGRKRTCWTMNDTDPSSFEWTTCQPRPDPDLISPLADSFFLTHSFRNDTSIQEPRVLLETHRFITVFTKQGSGPIFSQTNQDPPPHISIPNFLLTILPSTSRTNKMPFSFKHPIKIFYAFFSTTIHRPPHDYCNTPTILGGWNTLWSHSLCNFLPSYFV